MRFSIEQIKKMKLFDLVNHLNLSFHPSGGDQVLDFWIKETTINAKSIVLDVACSTGFFSRYITKRTGCISYGIDIDPNAIKSANELKEEENLSSLLHYSIQDAANLHFRSELRFSHIVFSNALAFIKEKDRSKVIDLLDEYLLDDGFLLVNSFFYKEEVNNDLLEKLEELCDLKITAHCDYEYWNSLFENKFNLIVEGALVDKNDYSLSSDELEIAVDKVLNGSKKFMHLPETEQNAFRDRLLTIRIKANENQKYLDSKVQVWGKN